MAKTSAVYARIDTGLKEHAEGILHRLGISPSSAIQMLYSQIVLTKSFPLDLSLPYQTCQKPTAIGSMARSQLDAELARGYESTKSGKGYTADEIDQMMKDEFGI